MKLTAEISLYPLTEDYVEIIKELVRDLRRRASLLVITNAMSTQINGDYDDVIDAVRDALRASHERYGRQVLVCKFIVGDLDIAGTPDI